MGEIEHRTVQGSGPLVVLCHGFPESWYSWRHQLAALAAVPRSRASFPMHTTSERT